jgi:hypothetical protein
MNLHLQLNSPDDINFHHFWHTGFGVMRSVGANRTELGKAGRPEKAESGKISLSPQ